MKKEGANVSKINVLDIDTINKIAAGEVIERPASVVKELVENAIDAGANSITIEIKEGGISLIRVTDNGSGLEAEELPTAFLRHATSKIRAVEDLLTVSSLGFRGEALSSIAAISQVELITKTKQALIGARYTIEGGMEKKMEEVGAPEGTTFIVRNLFFNTPARRKFLKSAQTEAGHISDLIERLALSNPNISFKFINNNQNKLQTSGNGRLKDIVYQLYGREITRELIWVERESEHVRVEGFIGKPSISRGNRAYENYYINGRYVKSEIISKAIEEGYKTHVMAHRYPYTILYFQLDGKWMDINVHPTKMELRFSNELEIFETVYQLVKGGLADQNLIPEVSVSKQREKKHIAVTKPETTRPEPFEIKRMNEARNKEIEPVKGKAVKATLPKAGDSKGTARDVIREPSAIYQIDVTSEPLIAADRTQEPSLDEKQPMFYQQASLFGEKSDKQQIQVKPRIIGQLFSTYWLIEYEEKFYMLDQHAAHEKVLYEQYVKEFDVQKVHSQQVLPPSVVSLSMVEEEVLKAYGSFFVEMGFEIEHFGGKEYKICAVPYLLYHIAEKEMFMQMIDELAEDGIQKDVGILKDKIAVRACKAAVKGNQKMTMEEVESLISSLLALDNPYTCPHGRPTMIAMTRSEIEKKFKRIVS